MPFDAGAVLADINVGLLYILAVSSLGVYGVILARAGRPTRNIPSFRRCAPRRRWSAYEVSIGFVPDLRRALAGQLQPERDRQGARRAAISAIVNGLRLQPAAVPDGGGVPDLGTGRDRARAVRPD